MTLPMTNNIRIQDTSATHVVTANLIMEVSVFSDHPPRFLFPSFSSALSAA